MASFRGDEDRVSDDGLEEDDYDEDDSDIEEDAPVTPSVVGAGRHDAAEPRPARPVVPTISLRGESGAPWNTSTGVSRVELPKIPLPRTEPGGEAAQPQRPASAVPPLGLAQPRPTSSTSPTEEAHDQNQQQHAVRASAPPQARDSSTAAAAATAGPSSPITCHLLSAFDLPTASSSTSSSAALQQAASQLGVAPSQVQLFQLTPVRVDSVLSPGSVIAASIVGSGEQPASHLQTLTQHASCHLVY